jgi:hypothetical protein
MRNFSFESVLKWIKAKVPTTALAVISYSRHRGSERVRSFHIHLVNAPTQRTYLANRPSFKYLIFRPSLSPEKIFFSLIHPSTPPPLLSSSPPLLLSFSSPSGIPFQKQFIHLFSRKPTLTLESSSLENETSLVLSSQSIPASANTISTIIQHLLRQSAHCVSLHDAPYTIKQPHFILFHSLTLYNRVESNSSQRTTLLVHTSSHLYLFTSTPLFVSSIQGKSHLKL